MNALKMPTFDDVLSAADRLSNVIVKTPLLRCDDLSEKLSAEIYVKPECLQRVGAFKFRGAYNRLSRLTEDEKSRGVVAFSSGNHAQGVALSAKLLGIKAIIVMPEDSPKMKLENTRNYGAEIITYDREKESREEIANQVSKDTGAIVVPSYEDFYIISGQGTAALEAIRQAEEKKIRFDTYISPIGGGGLISGCSTAIKELSPETEIYGVEPNDFNDVQRSLKSGKIEKNVKNSGSVCDAILTPCPGAMTFAIMQKYLSGVLTISDQEALAAVKYAWEKMKLVVEPGGGAGLAALLAGKVDVTGKTVCFILSGGNVDEETFAEAIRT